MKDNNVITCDRGTRSSRKRLRQVTVSCLMIGLEATMYSSRTNVMAFNHLYNRVYPPSLHREKLIHHVSRKRWNTRGPSVFSSSTPAPWTTSVSPIWSRITSHIQPARRYDQRLYSDSSSSIDAEEEASESFFAQGEGRTTFSSLGFKSPVLIDRLNRLGFERPSAVQASVWEQFQLNDRADIVVGAETGSGKTLAYLLPLLDDILAEKNAAASESAQTRLVSYEYARAIVLVPNKELANQVVRMASKLCTDDPDSSSCVVTSAAQESSDTTAPKDVVRLAILPGGLASPNDFRPFREAATMQRGEPVDILLATPAVLAPWGLSPKNIDFFADVATLVVDEADMLLDGGFQQHLNNILMGFKRADRIARRNDEDWSFTSDDGSAPARVSEKPFTTQHILVGATIPNYGLKSVDAYILKKFPKVQKVIMDNMHNARHNGLRDTTTWIMDEDDNDGGRSSNIQRLQKLVAMLKGDSSSNEVSQIDEWNDLSQDKVMIFVNTVEDVEGVAAALGRAGIEAVPYHAKLSLQERTVNLTRFRRFAVGNASSDIDSYTDSDESEGEVPVAVLVCTDLASRGLDIPGVTAIVQLQFAGNVVAHLHRMGRTGRAGVRNGRGVIFYGEAEELLVRQIQLAEKNQMQMQIEGDLSDEDDEVTRENSDTGKVKNAFSRKRGFTKKFKKAKRAQNEQETR